MLNLIVELWIRLLPLTWMSSIIGALVVAGTCNHSANIKETNFIMPPGGKFYYNWRY
jgi:hypothetical protein